MTDNEIIKEVTEAYNQNLNAGCYVGDLLRIINHLKTENEEQEKAIINALQRIKEVRQTINAEVERYKNREKEIKAGAYKEVFEKLNKKAVVRKAKLLGKLYIVKVVALHDINALKKELVGEDND